MSVYKLESGASLDVKLAPFKDGRNLFKVFAKALKKVDLGGHKSVNAEIDLNLIKDVVLTAVSEPEIEQAILVCAERSLYNGQAIIEEMFDDKGFNRGDYFYILLYVAYENCAPFTNGLLSELKTLFPQVVKDSLR